MVGVHDPDEIVTPKLLNAELAEVAPVPPLDIGRVPEVMLLAE